VFEIKGRTIDNAQNCDSYSLHVCITLVLEYSSSRTELFIIRGRTHAVALWLRHYATNQKVAGSIRDEVIFFFKFT
jgi:hypothetical protein